MSEENMKFDLFENSQISFELLSADASIIQRATGVTKENMSALKMFHDGEMKSCLTAERAD